VSEGTKKSNDEGRSEGKSKDYCSARIETSRRVGHRVRVREWR
jgi:hypothetical protein